MDETKESTSNWKPIDTAPKDGSEMLLLCYYRTGNQAGTWGWSGSPRHHELDAITSHSTGRGVAIMSAINDLFQHAKNALRQMEEWESEWLRPDDDECQETSSLRWALERYERISAKQAAQMPKIKSEDSVILRPDQHGLYHACCDCGLLHRIVFSPRDAELRLKFEDVGHELPADANIDTKIVRGE